MARKDDLIHEIGDKVLADPKTVSKVWDGLSLVATISDGSEAMHGFRYWDEERFEASTPSEAGDILDRLSELRAEMARETGNAWHQCLIHIWRPGPQIRLQFEYEDSQRWKPKITGLDMSEYANSIRPPTA